MNFSFLPSYFMCFTPNLIILASNEHALMRKPSEKRRGTKVPVPGHYKVRCPSKLTNRFFVLISGMGFRTMNFSCLPSVFMCSTQNLVLSEYGQHECSDEKTLKRYLPDCPMVQKRSVTVERHRQSENLKVRCQRCYRI